MSSSPQQNEATPTLCDQTRGSSPSNECEGVGVNAKGNEASNSASNCSSPPEPFPELNEDLDSELADLSPAFAHEVNSYAALEVLTLPGPADSRGSYEEPEAMESTSEAKDYQEHVQDSEGMREATQRQLQWVRMMFGKEAKSGDAKKEQSHNHDDKGEAS